MKELISSIKNLPSHFITSTKNIWRNGVMTVSSVFAVMITLLLVGVVGLVAVNVQGISSAIEEGVRIYVKLDRDITAYDETKVGNEIKKIDGILTATYFTKDEELDKLIDGYEGGAEMFESYRNDNPLGAAYEVEIIDPTTISEIAEDIKDIQGVNSASFGGTSTNDMLGTLQIVQQAGSVFIVCLLFLAIFMISNTIKITINTRKVEISIMRMVGASNWYIRIPFMLEGMIIGILGAILPMIVLTYGYIVAYSVVGNVISSAMLPLIAPMPFMINVCFILFGLGAGVGLLGSFVSIHKFLKF